MQPQTSSARLRKQSMRAFRGLMQFRALTLSAARRSTAFRTGWASVDKGKIANLVVTKGDAFEDKTTVEYVFVDGKLFKPSKVPPASPAGGGGAGPRTPPPPENVDLDESGEPAGDGGRN